MIVVTQPYGDELHVAFPYNAEIVQAMRGVPTAHWEPHFRVWSVGAAYAVELAYALRMWESQMVWREVENPLTPAQPDVPKLTTWAQAMFAAVGPERTDAAFRALSKVLHPDLPNGSDDLMRQLIEARESVRST